jgi:hypothetical protein
MAPNTALVLMAFVRGLKVGVCSDADIISSELIKSMGISVFPSVSMILLSIPLSTLTLFIFPGITL